MSTGYSKDHARRVIIVGLRGYEAAKRRAERSGVRMHRSFKAGAEGRKIRKLLAKTSWYKEKEPEATGEAGTDSDSEPFGRFLLTPPRRTPQESRAMSPGFRVKVVEKSGTTHKSILVKSNIWAEGKCGMRKCLPC